MYSSYDRLGANSLKFKHINFKKPYFWLTYNRIMYSIEQSVHKNQTEICLTSPFIFFKLHYVEITCLSFKF